LLSKKWDDMMTLSETVAKGISSIRSLKLIRKYVIALNDRVEEFKKLKNVEQIHLGEISNQCNLLDQSILSSIENWNDILPEEANIIKLVDEKKQLEESQKSLINELNEIKRSDKNNQEKINKYENEIARLNSRLEQVESSMNTTGSYISSTDFSSQYRLSMTPLDMFGGTICSRCEGTGMEISPITGTSIRCSICNGRGKVSKNLEIY